MTVLLLVYSCGNTKVLLPEYCQKNSVSGLSKEKGGSDINSLPPFSYILTRILLHVFLLVALGNHPLAPVYHINTATACALHLLANHVVDAIG